MTVDVSAPVSAVGSIEIGAPPQAVWEILVGIDEWPSWNPDVKWVRCSGAVEAGTEFTWKAGPGTIRSTFTHVESPRLLAWKGTTLGIHAVHVWRLDASPSGTKLVTEESWAGLLPRIASSTMTKTLQKAIDSGLEAVRATAER